MDPIQSNSASFVRPTRSGSAAPATSSSTSVSLKDDRVELGCFRPQRLQALGGNATAKTSLTSAAQMLADMQPLPSKTFLVTGHAGSGKSALVNAFAQDLADFGLPTLHKSGAELLVGGPSAINSAFDEALAAASQSRYHSSVFVVDNVDAITRIRDQNPSPEAYRNAENLQVFANRLESLQKDSGNQVVLLATTSRPDDMDWLASKKFEQQVEVSTPQNANERKAILQSLVQGLSFSVTPDTETGLAELAGATPGKNPGDLKKILNQAQAMGGLSAANLREARLAAQFGPAQPVTVPDWMFQLSVSHELGHAVIRQLFDRMAVEEGRMDSRPLAIDCLSFVPRQGTQASVALKPNGNPAKTFPYYFAEISSNYGGRSAEYLFGNGHVSAGPGNDIDFATGLANECINQNGMGQNLGPINPGKVSGEDVQSRASDDRTRLLQAAEQVSMTVVYFYQDFIRQESQNFLAHKNDLTKLVWAGSDFSSALEKWESADANRSENLKNLKKFVREQVASLQPKMPLVFDAASGQFISAQDAAKRIQTATSGSSTNPGPS